ncbi:ATP-binding protein [Shewanella sp. AS16]|uniref:ATP-binding protein n=1 Tax=Shewanella sp. AS16 TaxID=2907625 RepID=UPI001F4277A6|nr:ATP-binding protein [Shewanella sp. AS16]MCE9686043.1 ATP-binding protein [Shewanella sp. AS16]
MTFHDLVLLPSQEAMVQRLHHIASYSEQLLVLSGARGAGKTTLVTALATEFDDYNSALVTCPMHADSAEIRRKILVQLISSPLFDDEVPLADTLLRVTASLGKPLHIIIDDAHLLPMTLWAECIILSQLKCAGKAIALTLTVAPAFLDELMAQLPEPQRKLLLPVGVEPLGPIEREALYRSLLIRSGQTPFAPRDIIRAQLERQSGTPGEVVTLLELALNDAPSPQAKWRGWHLAGLLAVLLALTAGLYWFIGGEPRPAEGVAPGQAGYPELRRYGQAILAPQGDAAAARPSPLALAGGGLFSADADADADADVDADANVDAGDTQVIEAQAATPEAVIPEAAARADQAAAPVSSRAQENTAEAEVQTVEPALAAAPVAVEAAAIARPQRPIELIKAQRGRTQGQSKVRKGYTLQLASMTKRESLAPVMHQLAAEKEIYLGKYRKRWLIFMGSFDDMAAANLAAQRLVQRYRFEAPWPRPWADLGEYEVQQVATDGEIPQ